MSDEIDELEEPTGDGGAGSGAEDVPDTEFQRLLEKLHTEHNFDFRQYKEVSLLRRIRHRMAQLHVTYSGEPGPTDVLAFPMGEDGLLGDVVICPAEAGRSNEDLEPELRLLVVHGTLHLLGHDHEDPGDKLDMWSRQERYSGVHLEDQE